MTLVLSNGPARSEGERRSAWWTAAWALWWRGARWYVLDSDARLEFEGLLQWLRLTFLVSAVLIVVASGTSAEPYALLVTAATLGSYSLVWTFLHWFPTQLIRVQPMLRVLDIALVYLVLDRYHAFLGDAYYDAAYLLFVVAAAATHGRPGALLVSAVATFAVFASRQHLIALGILQPEARHITDTIFYALFFFSTGLAVAFLMWRSGESVERREYVFHKEIQGRNEALTVANRRLQVLAAENQHLFRQAQEAIRARDEFLASASHDLKNPLVAIKAYAQMLMGEATSGAPMDTSRLAERLARIEVAARRIQALADELSDVAQLEMGEALELERSEIDLVQLAKQLAADFQQSTRKHYLRVESETPAIMGWWDGGRIERVIANLLSNAVKYSPDGGDIVVTVSQIGDNGELSVRDSGLGIPEADIPHLFERFHRGGNVAGYIAGTGLGLWGTRAILEQHGGAMEVQSREGAGTVVTMRLPIHTPAAQLV